MVLNSIEPQHLGLKLEAFVISKLDEHVTLNCQWPLNKLISECCELIQDNLEFILMEKNVSGKVKMNYTNYEHAIVERHGVELTKWPLPGGVKNPLKWVSLSDEELVKRMKDNRDRHAHGEQVYVQRKARACVSQPKSKATVNTDDELSSSSSSSSSSDLDSDSD
ncbi:uncharacterized protein BJ212DRAFT_1489595 [Suillus subaureus]|uniref:Uncharacterized protein n=1 Tax=Suillus subaureus TaxID=48587 RepID=A0A9P7ASW4_9AGAM|nr:uncharacterized protein BJ212DRAFT_1489595 [Suillus subaureus]KAG1795854.1 hypothetical protein BJ212DRAFT_1489595 [Suillus subaureus]